jgi:STAM-binding protein
MTKHQMTQGYAPSLESMFNPSMRAPNAPASLLFVPDSKKPSNLYSPSMLPPPSSASAAASVSHPPSSIYGMPTPQHYPAQQPRPPQQSHPPSSYSGPTRPPPAVPQVAESRPPDSRITRSVSKTDPVVHDLKNVNVPRNCLPRFLAIAAINTAKNRETCGLLLGKDKGHKFVVTTLLIPKQHSTSDTCTMDEEELVMQFTEERNLISLGWVSS